MTISLIGQKGIPAKTGGVERYTEELAIRLVERGHDVVCYTRPGYSPGLKTYKGVRLVTSPTVKQKHIETIIATISSMLHSRFRVDPELIIVHSIGPALLLPFMRLLFPRIRIISIFQSRDDTHAKWGSLSRLLLKLGAWCSSHFATDTYTVSREIQEYCWDTLGRFIPMIPNGISLVDQHVLTRPRNIRNGSQFQMSNSEVRFVMVSRLIPHKRLEDAIKAIQMLPMPVTLDVYGDEPVGVSGYRKDLERIAAAGSQNVVFHGTRPSTEIQTALKNARAFIHCSESEGASLAVLEALGANTPLILSDIPSHQELEGPGIWRFPVGDVNGLHHQIVAMMNNPVTPSAQPWQAWPIIVSQVETLALQRS